MTTFSLRGPSKAMMGSPVDFTLISHDRPEDGQIFVIGCQKGMAGLILFDHHQVNGAEARRELDGSWSLTFTSLTGFTKPGTYTMFVQRPTSATPLASCEVAIETRPVAAPHVKPTPAAPTMSTPNTTPTPAPTATSSWQKWFGWVLLVISFIALGAAYSQRKMAEDLHGQANQKLNDAQALLKKAQSVVDTAKPGEEKKEEAAPPPQPAAAQAPPQPITNVDPPEPTEEAAEDEKPESTDEAVPAAPTPSKDEKWGPTIPARY